MSNKIKINILGFVAVLCWAIAFPFSKVAMTHFSPFALGFLRVSLASIALLLIGFFNGSRLPRPKDLILFFLAGACGFGLYLFAFNMGLQTITSASSSIIIAITPVMTAVAAHKLYKERINIIGWITLITAFAGVLIMMLWDGVLSFNFGMLWTFGAAVLFCAYNLLNRKLSMMGYKSIEIVTYAMISAAIILSPFAVEGVGQLQTSDTYHIIVLVALGMLSSAAAYFLWSVAMSLTTNTSEVANFSFLTPFFATLLGSIVLGEIPGMGTIIGGAIIIVSIIIFSKKGKV